MILTPVKAIRAKCLDCCCGSAHEVRLCHLEDCALWPYRFGKRPRREEIPLALQAENDEPTDGFEMEVMVDEEVDEVAT